MFKVNSGATIKTNNSNERLSAIVALVKTQRTGLIISLAIDAAGPYLIYTLVSPYVSPVMALILAALPPTLHSLVNLARKRKLDFLSSFILAGLVLSAVLVLLGGDARLLLVRESLLTGAFGLVFAVSALIKRPILYYLMHHLAKANPEKLARLETSWKDSIKFRQGITFITLVVGLGTVIETIVSVTMVFSMNIGTFLAVSPIVHYAILGLTLIIVVLYSRFYLRRTN